MPADCRILESAALEVDESSLTGEAFAVRKGAEPSTADSVAERRSMLYAGTTVTAGWAHAVVVAHGPDTEAGRAAMDYAFDVLQAEEVVSLIRPANNASIRVAERLGESYHRTVQLLGSPACVYRKQRRGHKT